jgi:hypothetical protein
LCFFGRGLSYHHRDCPARASAFAELLTRVSDMRPSAEACLEILHENRGGTGEERKRLFRELRLRCHPDKGGDKEAFRQLEAEKENFLA